MGSFSVVAVVIKKIFHETLVATLDPLDAKVMLNQSNDNHWHITKMHFSEMVFFMQFCSFFW